MAGEARLHAAEVVLIHSQRAESIHLLMSGVAHNFGNLSHATSISSAAGWARRATSPN